MKHCAPLIRKGILSTGNGFLRGNCGPRQGLGQAPPAAIRVPAELRAQAAVAVDRITGGYTADEVADWHEVEQKLVEAYSALK